MKKEKLFNWKVKLQLVFVVLMLLLLNAIAPKPFAKHEQVECINIEERQLSLIHISEPTRPY